MTQHAFLAAYGQIFRALPYLPGHAAENAIKVFELHQRYGREIMGVVETELRNNAELDRILDMQPTSLLALIGAPSGVEMPAVDPGEKEPPASTQAASNVANVKNRRFVMAVDETAKEIIFSDGPILTGVAFRLIERLARQFRIDLDSRAKPGSYVPTCTLMDDLKITEHTLGQRVMRIRKSLKEQFFAATSYIIDEQDVIQSVRWRGYRLNPYLLLVPPSQLQNDGHVMTSSRMS